MWSRRHWNETPDSLSVNLKVTGPGAPGLGGSGGTNDGVGGGTVSTSHEYNAGAEMLPASSRASTKKVCEPCERPSKSREFPHERYAAPSSLQRKSTPRSESA